MKGDFSKLSFDPAENYTGVLEQQGRVRIDQDGNAETQIVNHLRTTLVQDAVGTAVAAVPESMPDGFEVVSAQSDGNRVQVTMKPGRIWADGIPLQSPIGKNLVMEAEYFGPPISSVSPDVASIGTGVRDAVVLEVWEEAVNAFQDTELLETALGGVDTSERIKAFYPLRLLRLRGNEDCSDVADRLATKPAKGRLTTTLAAETVISGDCPVEAGGGYSGFEHSLYRVEIAEPDTNGDARFKWSSYNASLVGRGRYTPTPGDATLGTVDIRANEQVINHCGLTEFYFEALSFDAARGRWTIILTASATLSGNGDQLTLQDVDQVGVVGTEPVFFRLWNGTGLIKDFPKGASANELKDGILLEFDAPAPNNENYLPGDYWTFPVRAAGVEFDPSAMPADAEPQGVTYHRVPLAVLNWSGRAGAPGNSASEIDDCRKIFPQLVNVRGGCCIDVAPGEDLHAAVRKLKDAGGGCICLLPGQHAVTRPIDLSGESGICIKGFGVVSQLNISPKIGTIAFNLVKAHDICFDGFAVMSGGDRPIWGCADTTDLTLTNLFVFAKLHGDDPVIATNRGTGSRWHLENNVFIAPSGLSGLSVHQSIFRGNYWLGVQSGIQLRHLVEVAIEYNYFFGISDEDLREFLALSVEVKLKEEFTRQNLFRSLLQFLTQQSTRSTSTRYNAIDVAGGFDLTVTGNRMAGRVGLDCEVLENAKIDNNDFFTTLFGLTCGIARNLTISENRIGRLASGKSQAAIRCKAGVRVIDDVIDCRVLHNKFDNVEEGIVFESDTDGGKETIRDFGIKSFIGSSKANFDPKKALRVSEALTAKSRSKYSLLTNPFFLIGKIERVRIEGNFFRARKLALEMSGAKRLLDLHVSGNSISGCQQTAIQIEVRDWIGHIFEPIETRARLIENNRFDIFGAAIRSTTGALRIEGNDIRVRKRPRPWILGSHIAGVLGEKLYADANLMKANTNLDFGGSRMSLVGASHAAKKNPGSVDMGAFASAVKKEYLHAHAPHAGDTGADDLNLMMTLANAGASKLLLDFSETRYLKANVIHEGFALNLGGIENRVNGNAIRSDSPETENGIIFHFLSGEARENVVRVQRIGLMMNAKAGQTTQDARIEGNTLKVTGPQSSGGESEIAYALSIPTLKPGNLSILDNYFEGSVMVGAEPFASLGLKGGGNIKPYPGLINYHAMKFDSGAYSNVFNFKAQPPVSGATLVKDSVVKGLLDLDLSSLFWKSNPHSSRPVVQFGDNRVVRGWVAIAQSTAGAFWSVAGLKKRATQTMVLTLTGNTLDYWARVAGHDLIITGNHSQGAIQYRVGNRLEHVANIPQPKTF